MVTDKMVFSRKSGNGNNKSVPRVGQRGAAAPRPTDFSKKKVNFLKKFVFLGKKWDFAPPENLFFILPPSKISSGYALVGTSSKLRSTN